MFELVPLTLVGATCGALMAAQAPDHTLRFVFEVTLIAAAFSVAVDFSGQLL
ncbi:MAG: hypothetical protein R3C68_06085 [Myxococcota bacterium]